MIHDHLKFYSNSSSNRSKLQAPGLFGGEKLVPELNVRVGSGTQYDEDEGDDERDTDTDYVAIVDYLKALSSDQKATFIDIHRELGISLRNYPEIVERLKSNPKIEYGHDQDGSLYFQYRLKYLIRNREELLRTLERVSTGIALNDIQDCYPYILDDCREMTVGGEIIAAYNKEKKSQILYSRGKPFYTELSGEVLARPGEQCITTTNDLQAEIRRGEAMKVGEYWYRIACNISNSSNGQPARATAPPSVTLDRSLPERNVYVLPFTSTSIPLDGVFEGEKEYKGKVIRHGATSDVKEYWQDSAEDVRKYLNNDDKLIEELVKQNLISKYRSSQDAIKSLQNKNGSNMTGKRKRKERESTKMFTGFGTNAHLKGTQLEKILRATAQEAAKNGS